MNKYLPNTPLKCKYCQKIFMVFPYRVKTAKYCSRECQASSYIGKRMSPKTEFKSGVRVSTKTEFKKGHKLFTGELNSHWKGEDASYSSKHKWIYRKNGKALICEVCKTKSSKRYEWANLSGNYKRVLSDWASMCKMCHSKFDRGVINFKGICRKIQSSKKY